MPDSTRKKPSQKLRKPPKVGKKFPLWPHPSGRWCKKVKQKFHYFGRWDDPDFDPAEAEAKWDREKAFLKAGETPPESCAEDRLTLKGLFDAYLARCDERVDADDMKRATMADYQRVCQRIADIAGKNTPVDGLRPDDFRKIRAAVSKTCGPVAVSSFITRARVPFAWALKNELIDRQVRYGSEFEKPTSQALLKHRNTQEEKFFEASELRTLIDGASQPMKSFILLGINAAYGNSDVGNLPLNAVDLESGVIEFPRPKTGEYRRAILWPETLASLREWDAQRPKAKLSKDKGLFFLTKYGASWATETSNNPVSNEFSKLAGRLNLSKRFRGFYSCRHTFRTVAADADTVTPTDTLTPIAIIMGHRVPGMGSGMNYVKRNRIRKVHLKAVTDVVRAWLFEDQQDEI